MGRLDKQGFAGVGQGKFRIGRVWNVEDRQGVVRDGVVGLCLPR